MLSLAELFACGLDDDAIARRCQSGRLHRLYRGVYAVGHANPPRSGRLLARRHDGVPVTSPARTIVDLAGVASSKALRRAAREAQSRHLAAVPEVLRVVERPVWLDGRKVIPDFRWPELKLVVEADGAAWHDNKLAREDDAERQALLEEHGEQVLRITWDQAVRNPAQTVKRVQRASGALDSLASS